MKKQQVADLIGEPDFSSYFETRKDPKDKPRFVAWKWGYFFRKGAAFIASPEDEAVQVFFDKKDEVIQILPWNLPNLKGKGDVEFDGN